MSSLVSEPKSRRDIQRDWRAGRTEKGNCVRCAKPRGDKGTTTMCRRHADEENAKILALRDQRREAGLCEKCGEPRGKGGTSRYCHKHAEDQNEHSRRDRVRLFDDDRCYQHRAKRSLIKIKLCPVCLYENSAIDIHGFSFKGLIPPPSSGDQLEKCVGCERCRKIYHRGGSYSFPKIPAGLKLRDEQLGEDGQGLKLLFSLEDAQGVPVEYERCSVLPDDICSAKVTRLLALVYARRHRTGEPTSGACKAHVHNRPRLTLATESRIRLQLGTPEDECVVDPKLEAERSEFESVVRSLLKNLPRHKIQRPQIAEEYDRRRNTREPLDPSTITYIVKRCYPKGTTVADAVALVPEST